MINCIHDWKFLPHGGMVECAICHQRESEAKIYPYEPPTGTYENYAHFNLDNSVKLLGRN